MGTMQNMAMLIRRGAVLRPGSLEFLTEGGSSYYGALVEAAFPELAAQYLASIKHYKNSADISIFKIGPAMDRAYPELFGGAHDCHCCDNEHFKAIRLHDLLLHLEAAHDYSREQIADYIESVP